MPRYNPKTFTRPESLKRMDPVILLALLERFAEFFSDHGLDLEPLSTDQELPYPQIAQLIATPDDAPELAGALYLIDEMASEKRFDDLIERTQVYGLPEWWDEPTPADLATFLWLRDPAALQRLHASSYLDRQRRFTYFHDEPFDHLWSGPTGDEIATLEAELADWFLRAKRGRGCRVFYFFRQDEHWFLVWHGQAYRREGSVVDGEPGTVVYRPEKYDILGLHPERGEIKIHAATKNEVELYREVMAHRVLGVESTFHVTDRYSLKPLQDLGPGALQCHDIPGIAWIKLREVQLDWGGPEGEIEIRRAKDLFAAFAADGRELPANVRVRSAKFGVAFRGGRRARSVVLRPPNVVHYTRDPDSVPIEDWLRKRGFYSGDGWASGGR